MKILILFISFIVSFINISNCYGFKGSDELINDLKKGKTTIYNKSNGLGYTPEEFTVLETAYRKLFDTNENSPVCEVMKISVELNYNAYDVILLLYSMGKEVNIDQLCMCSVEQGINRAIIANASINAKNTIDEPIFSMDEISQSQCLRGEEGLGYSEFFEMPPYIQSPENTKPISEYRP